jgi:hypothetical protein
MILMGRFFKIAALAIGVTALVLLGTFGFALWVFLPLAPAAIVYLIAVYALRGKRTTIPARPSESEAERRRAA